MVQPWLRFHIPLIEPDVQISRIRLSDQTSRFRPRAVASPPSQPYESESVVEDRRWIAPASLSALLELGSQPPAQPRSDVAVDRPVRAADGPYLEVVCPAAQGAVQLAHHLRGLLPRRRHCCHRMELFHHASDALLGRPHAQTGLAGRRRIQPPERVTQEVELA